MDYNNINGGFGNKDKDCKKELINALNDLLTNKYVVNIDYDIIKLVLDNLLGDNRKETLEKFKKCVSIPDEFHQIKSFLSNDGYKNELNTYKLKIEKEQIYFQKVVDLSVKQELQVQQQVQQQKQQQVQQQLPPSYQQAVAQQQEQTGGYDPSIDYKQLYLKYKSKYLNAKYELDGGLFGRNKNKKEKKEGDKILNKMKTGFSNKKDKLKKKLSIGNKDQKFILNLIKRLNTDYEKISSKIKTKNIEDYLGDEQYDELSQSTQQLNFYTNIYNYIKGIINNNILNELYHHAKFNYLGNGNLDIRLYIIKSNNAKEDGEISDDIEQSIEQQQEQTGGFDIIEYLLDSEEEQLGGDNLPDFLSATEF